MKIYTKSGDKGTTGLFAGPRVSKDHPRIAAYGTVDELNAMLGVIASSNQLLFQDGVPLNTFLQEIQSDLFSIGAELATPNADKQGMRLLDLARIEALEARIDAMQLQLSPLESFVLPGGTQGSSMLQWARTVCRRAEREVVHLTLQPDANECDLVVIYLNRLSDLLFVLARYDNHCAGVQDIPWRKPS